MHNDFIRVIELTENRRRRFTVSLIVIGIITAASVIVAGCKLKAYDDYLRHQAIIDQETIAAQK